MRIPALFSGFLLLAISTADSFAVDETEPAPRPHILFCIADDASYPHFGAYGCTWTDTPAFDRVAREGVLFSNAWTPNAKCAPSRACILTGRNPWQLEAACNHMPYFPVKFRTYAEVLAEHGYFVGKTAKGWAPGVAEDAEGHLRELAGHAFDARRLQPPTRGITNVDYAGNFEDFLDARPSDQPFCFWYGCREPHRRYEYGTGVRLGGRDPSDVPAVPEFWPDNEVVRSDMLDYGYEVEYFDTHLGRMLALLEERDLLADTLVVVTSDNGMPFPRIKGQEYALSNHLPLAVMWPHGIAAPGRVVDDFVNFIDFAPTFLEVAGVDPEAAGMQPMTGRSLIPIFESDRSGIVEPQRDHVLIGKERHDVGRPHDWGYPIRGIVRDGFLYLRNFETTRWPAGNPETGYLNCDGSPTKSEVLDLRRNGADPSFWAEAFGFRPADELYHITGDEQCLHNLADDPDFADRRDALREAMLSELREQGDPRALGRGEIFDEYPVASPTANYYERFTSGERVPAGWVNRSDYETEPIESPPAPR
jgi:arylsulfatase A-like enzyme